MPESEAQKIAIVLEETWAYEYKENKKQGRGGSGGGEGTGLRPEFEEDFAFGDDDDNDYSDKLGLIEFWHKEEVRRGITSVQSL